jgi:hypothetical protein
MGKSAVGAHVDYLGQAAIDKKYTVKSHPEDFAKQLFELTELSSHILSTQLTILRVSRNELLFEREGFERKASSIYYFDLFDLVCDIADEVESITKKD